jgi:hypothetical protein
MLIATAKPLDIGGRYQGLWTCVGDLIHIDQPFVVLRETTFEEWCNLSPAGAFREESEQIDPSEALFYYISLD